MGQAKEGAGMVGGVWMDPGGSGERKDEISAFLRHRGEQVRGLDAHEVRTRTWRDGSGQETATNQWSECGERSRGPG